MNIYGKGKIHKSQTALYVIAMKMMDWKMLIILQRFWAYDALG